MRSHEEVRDCGVNALWPGSFGSPGGGGRPRWYHVGKRRPGVTDAAGSRDKYQPGDSHRAPDLLPATQERLAADNDGALVARSQILISGSTATLLGTLTNETGSYVYFSGMPPYAFTFETDGSEIAVLGDFSSPPRERPSSGDCVMHPGAVVPYRSLPVRLQNPRPLWDGTDWSAYSQSTMLDMTFRNQWEVTTIQIFD